MDIYGEFKKKYPHFSDEESEQIIKRAKALVLDRLYPADLSIDCETWDMPPRAEMWVFNGACELVRIAGFENLVAYKENGVSFNWERAGVSTDFLNSIPRIVGVIK